MHVYTEMNECDQEAGPSCPCPSGRSLLAQLSYRALDACSSGEMLLPSWFRLAVIFSFLLSVPKNKSQIYPGEETCLPSSCPQLNLVLDFLQQSFPTSPTKVQGSFEQGLMTSCEAESWDVQQGCC